MAKVKALRSFQSEGVGSREEGERFDYDVDRDPHRLVKDGFVEAVEKPAPADKPSK